MTLRVRASLAGIALAFAFAACSSPVTVVIDSDVDAAPDVPVIDQHLWPGCNVGDVRCVQDFHQTCVAGTEFTTVREEDCGARGLVCSSQLGCVVCHPGEKRCTTDTAHVETCPADGSGFAQTATCDLANGEACRNGECERLCADETLADTNIGCEYYAVDLDNYSNGVGSSAASQQYAVVVSNIDEQLTARVKIEWNTALPGQTPHPVTVDSTVIAPQDLEVFMLPAREVDCSAPGTFNTGTGTCLSSQAYRITSTIPVIAYQFNPLSNADVFSNDASLLLPSNSLEGDYVALGYPQTIATTRDTATNFGEDARSFLTLVGTQDHTHVRILPSTDFIPGAGFPDGLRRGGSYEVDLGPFDVLNLETGTFHGDPTGTRVIPTSGAVALFAGSEAADSPAWDTLSERRCCADHMEEQNPPVRTAGYDFIAAHLPLRSSAVAAAGGTVAIGAEPDYYRILNVGTGIAHVTTTLPSDVNEPRGGTVSFDLGQLEVRTLTAFNDFEIHSDTPLSVALVSGGQATSGIPTGLPGGDPSFIIVPPEQQWRPNYVFLTPDKYAFDFVTIVARANVNVTLDDTPLPFRDCPLARADSCVEVRGQDPCPPPAWVVYRCQLSFPVIDPARRAPGNVSDGQQHDGVHAVRSDAAAEGVLVLVTGFDNYVGYGYPAGMRTVTVPR